MRHPTVLLLVLLGGCGPTVLLCDDGACSDATPGDGSDGDATDSGGFDSTSAEPESDESTAGPGTPGEVDDGNVNESSGSGAPPGPMVTPGDPTPCLGGGNIMILDGDEGAWVQSGSAMMETTNVLVTEEDDPLTDLQFWFEEGGPGGPYFSLRVRTTNVPALLAEGEYPDAMRAPFEDAGHPGFDLTANHNGCNQLGAWFQIHEMTRGDAGLSSFTATWSHYCENGPHEIRGCMHWER